MVKGLFIPADTDQPVEVRSLEGHHDYAKAIDGWLEAVDVPPLGVTMYVNEEGQLRKLPFNPRATFLWWYELPHVRQKAMLVGDVLMVGSPDPDGIDTNIPESTLALLTNRDPYAVIVMYGDSPLWVKHPFPYDDYFEAVVWAMILSERVTDTNSVRVVTLDQLLDIDQKEVEDQENWGNQQF